MITPYHGYLIQSLPESDQELLHLVTWEGLKLSEIAVVLKISPEVARTRLYRARNNLREQLEKVVYYE